MTEPKSGKRDSVDATTPAYDRQAQAWDLIHDLLGGTRSMRAAGTKWLPKEAAETQDAYAARLHRSVLYEAFKDTVDGLASKPFQRPISLSNVPKVLDYIEDDSDLTGLSLTQLAGDLLEDMVKYGRCHILVDFAKISKNVDPESTERASIAEEQAAGARSVFVRVAPPDLIGVRAVDGVGRPEIAQIRMRETSQRAEGSYLVEEVQQVRVVERGSWSLWEKDESRQSDDQWGLKEGPAPHTFGRVFILTAYANRTGFMESMPPLEPIAWLNLAHWHSMSDQRNILRFCRFAILLRTGVGKADAEKPIALGPTNMVTMTSDKANMKYVEHTGKAVEAGTKDLADLENRMEAMGLQPLMRKPGQRTATEVATTDDRGLSTLQAWIRALETLLRDAYGMAAEWHKIGDLPDDFKLDIFSDFKVSSFGDADLTFLLKAAMAGKLSLETFLEEIKRRGKLADSVDAEEEIDRIEGQDDGLSDVGFGDEGDEDDDDDDDDDDDAGDGKGSFQEPE
jgi:hypothetical protein